MSDRLQRSMALMDAKADVKMIKERTNECWYDTKILANAVYLILEELTATDTTDTPQTDCDTCKHYKLACELFSEICKYEPTTQTETQNSNLTCDTPQTEEYDFRDDQEYNDRWQTDCGWK